MGGGFDAFEMSPLACPSGVAMTYLLGSDHAGADLKESLKAHLDAMGLGYVDLGTAPGVSVDYPDVAQRVAAGVQAGEGERGVLICGTGIGVCISANKVPGIRAALAGDTVSGAMARAHNNAQILCLGARVVGVELAKAIFDAYHGATFEGGRHQRRVDKIHGPESSS